MPSQSSRPCRAFRLLAAYLYAAVLVGAAAATSAWNSRRVGEATFEQALAQWRTGDRRAAFVLDRGVRAAIDLLEPDALAGDEDAAKLLRHWRR